jgi:hypothetical protein
MAYVPFATEVGGYYSLVSPAGVQAVFNEPTDPNYVGMLTEVTGLDSAEVRESANDLPEADGGVHGNFYMSRRPIVLNGSIFGHATVVERNQRMDRARRASMALRADSVLSWKPSKRVENLVPNPRLQNNTTGWSANVAAASLSAGATLTRVTGVAPPAGTTGGQIVTSGNTNANQGAMISMNLVAGRTYTVGAAYRRVSGAGSLNLTVSAVGGAVTTLLPTLTAGSWVAISATFTAAQSGLHWIGFRSPDSDTLGTTFQFSNVMVRPDTGTAYIDGDTSGYLWQGDAGNSPSGDFLEMFTVVRRQQPFRESGNWVKTFQIPLVSQYGTLFNTYLKTVAAGVAAENRGNWQSYPLVTITGSSTNPSVSDGTRTFVTSGLTLASGESVQFDMLNHTGVFTVGARVGQSANRYIDFATTQWPYLVGNGATTTFSSTGGGTTSIAVAYRDTWA